MRDDNNHQTPTSRYAGILHRAGSGSWYVAIVVALAFTFVATVLALLSADESPAGDPPYAADAPSRPVSHSSSPSMTSGGNGSPAAVDWDDLGCNGTKGSTETPNTTPAASWEPVGAMSAPVSKTSGPRRAEGFVRGCYQHTPTGAVFAATNSTVVARVVPETERAMVLSGLMTPGPGLEESIDAGTPDNTALRFAAFNVESCAPQRCNIRFIVSVGADLGLADLSMVWVQGDWWVDGGLGPQGGAFDTIPPGYVRWGV